MEKEKNYNFIILDENTDEKEARDIVMACSLKLTRLLSEYDVFNVYTAIDWAIFNDVFSYTIYSGEDVCNIGHFKVSELGIPEKNRMICSRNRNRFDKFENARKCK